MSMSDFVKARELMRHRFGVLVMAAMMAGNERGEASKPRRGGTPLEKKMIASRISAQKKTRSPCNFIRRALVRPGSAWVLCGNDVRRVSVARESFSFLGRYRALDDEETENDNEKIAANRR